MYSLVQGLKKKKENFTDVEVVLLIQGKYALLLFFIYKHLNVSKL
jgi:hypothetical protein